MYTNFASPSEHFAAEALLQQPPISFLYGGKPFPCGFEQTGAYEFSHTETGLVCRLETFSFGEDSPAVEWTVHFENRGSADSLIIENVCVFDKILPCEPSAFVGYLDGARSIITDFSYHEIPLAGAELRSIGSRMVVPFINIGTAEDSGWVLGIGWTGNWVMRCSAEGDNAVRVRCGMVNTHFLLHPGEQIRQPRMMALLREGNRERGENLCRRHLVINHIPKDENGEPFPPVCANVWGGMKAENHRRYCSYIKEHQLKFDYYWIDAGWHGPDHETEEFQNFYIEDWAYNIGEWRENRCVYPNGMGEVSRAVADSGMKLLLWFSSYDCNEGIGWQREHPEWGTPLSDYHPIGLNPKLTRSSTIDVSLPEARQWLMDTIGGLMEKNQVKGYREDTGLPYAGTDTPDRAGIAEITSVTALYEIWDSLRSRIPGLVIDNCGGGGSRVDLETISRSYVLWRSDYNCDPAADPIGTQSGNCGLGRFVPLVNGGVPVSPGNTYRFRSSLYGGMGFGMFHPGGFGTARIYPEDNYPVEWHRQMLEEYQFAKPLLSGDFYLFEDGGTETDRWCAYGFDRPDLRRGCVYAFCRQDCVQDTLTVHLRLPEGTYDFRDRDTGEVRTVTVAASGTDFTVHAPEKPYAASWYYTRVN